MTPNEISHYESLKKQDTANRKLIKKLQLDKQALKEQLILSGVSQQRELLKAYEIFVNMEININNRILIGEFNESGELVIQINEQSDLLFFKNG